MHNFSVGVLGASGYAGRELVGMIARHPRLRLAFAAANERRGQSLRVAGAQLTMVAAEDAPLDDADLVFCALPHGVSGQWARRAAAYGTRAIDLSADLRPGAPHSDANIPYGLTELSRAELCGADLVANPGCYATAVILGLAPLARAGLLPEGHTVSIAAASGVTGAGFTLRHDLLFAEVAEDYRPYAVGNEHRHLPEMRAALTQLGADVDIVFTPHLLPVARGILATMTVPVTAPLADPLSPWRELYREEPFIEITSEAPALRDVVRRNIARISASRAAGVARPTLIVTVALDNLLKGAAGQAVQNANLMLGLPETEGIPA